MEGKAVWLLIFHVHSHFYAKLQWKYICPADYFAVNCNRWPESHSEGMQRYALHTSYTYNLIKLNSRAFKNQWSNMVLQYWWLNWPCLIHWDFTISWLFIPALKQYITPKHGSTTSTKWHVTIAEIRAGPNIHFVFASALNSVTNSPFVFVQIPVVLPKMNPNSGHMTFKLCMRSNSSASYIQVPVNTFGSSDQFWNSTIQMDYS